MFKIPKQEYIAEFKELAVKRVQGGHGVGPVARELGLVEQTLRDTVKAAGRGQLHPAVAKWSHRNRWNCRVCVHRTPGSGWSAKS